MSDFLGEGPGSAEQTTRWCNTWSDGPDGWYFHGGDRVMAGFCISPPKGKWLRQRLAAAPRLKPGGFCEARLYEGQGQNVTAVLEGADPSREVWLYGHACEQGARDNVSAVTVLIEALRLLNELVTTGKLPRPRWSIRLVTTEECLGMAAFATLHDDLRRRAMAGLNVDGAGDAADSERPFVPCADDMIADPNCGVPAVWLGKGGASTGYHSSADTPDVCMSDSLRFNTLLAAAWAYTMASLDDLSAQQLIGLATEWIDSAILCDGDGDPAILSRWAARQILRSMARWGITASVYEPRAARYCPPDARRLPDRFQAGMHVATIEVDRLSLRTLFVGSPTEGATAPRPPVTHGER